MTAICRAWNKVVTYLSNVPTTATEQKPSEKFRKAMKQILSVPKKELERRELEYKEQRKIKSHHRHR
jgi:hypothetical protein